VDPETFSIKARLTIRAKASGLLVGARSTYPDHAVLVVGYPGLPNVEGDLGINDAVLFETPDGVYEVRALSTSPHSG